MVCTLCSSETKVINSRPQKRNNQVWRRRRCISCRAVFTTEEAPVYSASWVVKSRSGRLEPFSRDKLFLSLHKACQHRKTALSDSAGLTETIIKRLMSQIQNSTIETRLIVQTAQVTLNRFDSAASVSYEAFHA